MDHSKLDAGLAAALEDAAGATAGPVAKEAMSAAGSAAQDALSVFVHVDPNLSKAEQANLAKLGLPVGSAQGGIATATLSPEQVRQLSERPSVRRLRLSTPLRLVGDE
ncbi:MAG: hypothetical protein LC792_21375 [Actinobacteria bacterium]|nr:hypothetical protein [Actinomycetota bacterium]